MFEILPTDAPSVSTSLFATLAALCLWQLWSWLRRYRKWVAPYKLLPMDTDTHWFFGHMHKHPGPSEKGIAFQQSFTRPFPVLHVLWFGWIRPIIIVHHSDSIRPVLKASAHIAIKPRGPGTAYMLGIKWLGEGLLISNGNRWARNRRLLTPAFHFDMLRSYLGIQNACTDVLLGKLDELAEGQTSFEAFRHLGLCSLDIINQSVFSYCTDCQLQGENNPYVHAVQRLSDLWIKRSLRVHESFDFVYFNFTKEGREFQRLCDYVHSVSSNIIDQRKQKLASEGNEDEETSGLDFLDIILKAKDDDGRGLTPLEVRDEVDTFLFEGHDTTASAMSFLMYALAAHPDEQARCRQEIDDILEGRDSDILQYQDLARLDYLSTCIKEALRLYCPVFFIQRQMTEAINIEGFTIPEGSHVAIDIYNIHHNASMWGEDYDNFRPSRFEGDAARDMDPFAFVPFSAGPRNCIGQNFAMNEMKVVISRLLHRFEFSLKPGHVMRKKLSVVMRTEDGIWLDIKRREK
ncbi:ultra-long-chain fatty acid omega-hydroxylase-like isoform X1 [Mya arenaria]|uniref:ultra-long-chain fatty acid omega-hydroxylase-like isoform X1 n=1 Tax=Mya arenaria TaxID=6604 RepID=UPI0022E2486C|nr:ultra-long-chain fatty acid omega-hydroxylase-like isoform X1 [Mya arenaria]